MVIFKTTTLQKKISGDLSLKTETQGNNTFWNDKKSPTKIAC